ncbi:MAG: hypothetical protein KAV41_01410 [Candidatus Pacebacteria bacterium]|nr:hypothetical protein [Candidatus Paceibacterota bacterium]
MNSLKTIEKKNNNDLYLVFFSKKIEKIVAALYLLTSYFPKDEILKWKLRKQGIQLLSDTMSLTKKQVLYKDKILSDVRNAILEIISFLEIALTAKIITNMNLNVFKKELEFLLKLNNNNLKDISEQNLSGLSGDFFKIKDKDLRFGKTRESLLKDSNIYKGHYKGQTAWLSPTLAVAKKQGISNIEKRQSRRENILKLLRKGQKLTIKDISREINNCGEKTVQRELQAMLKDGLLKKEGERRWSRYSLK